MKCPQCGAAFEPRDKWQQCCSKACGRKRWNSENGANRSGGRDMLVTFTDASGEQVTRRGRGRTPGLARADAKAQLPSGFEAVAEHTSTVNSIMRSLERTARA